ncbi:hypothetical protein GCM10029976_066240 [Kribbella albertanoniae]
MEQPRQEWTKDLAKSQATTNHEPGGRLPGFHSGLQLIQISSRQSVDAPNNVSLGEHKVDSATVPPAESKGTVALEHTCDPSCGWPKQLSRRSCDFWPGDLLERLARAHLNTSSLPHEWPQSLGQRLQVHPALNCPGVGLLVVRLSTCDRTNTADAGDPL